MQKCSSTIYGRGKTTLPKNIRKQLNLHDGSRVVYAIDDKGIITLHSEDALAFTLKHMVTQATKGQSLVEELMKERKKVAENE